MNEPDKSIIGSSYNDVIDLRELIRVLWAGKWLIGAVAAAAAIIAVIVALMLPNIYRAEALLAPNEQQGAKGLAALASQYGGLASLAGINIGNGAADKTSIGLEVLQSRKFIGEFVERRSLLVPLIAAEGWDLTTGELRIDAGSYDIELDKWVRDAPSGKSAIPTRQEAYNKFREILSVSQDTKTGLVSVSVEHYSPELAKQWVDWLIEDINMEIMRQDVSDAEQAIEYLNKQIESTSIADLQSVFFGLIEEQMKTVLLANVTREYFLRTLDPAVVPEEKARPRRSLIVLLATFLGGLAGTAVQLIRRSRAANS